VLFLNYHIAEKKSINKYLTEEQENWILLQRLILKSKVDYTSMKPPENRIRLKIWTFLQDNSYLDKTILFVILLNILTFAAQYETQT